MPRFHAGQACCVGLMMILVVLAPGALAGTYVVDTQHPSADDLNPGTLVLPWATLAHACDVLVAGDTVLIRAGVYNEQLVSQRSGDVGQGPLVFGAYPGEVPVIDGTGVVTGNNGVVIAHSYISLLGLEVRSWADNGIWVDGAAHVEISDCDIHHVGFGVGLANGAHDFVLNRVVMHHYDLYGFDASPGGGDACYNGILNDCVAHTGRDPAQNVDGFALGHGTQQNFILNRCETYGVFDGFDISSRATVLNRCTAHDCWNGGYKVWEDEVQLVNCLGYRNAEVNIELDWDEKPGVVSLMNCTFFAAGTASILVESRNDTLEMCNCIIAGGENTGLVFAEQSATNYRGDFNIFHNKDADRTIVVGYVDEFSTTGIAAGIWSSYSGQDVHSQAILTDESLFENSALGDFHPSPGSVAIDQGTTVGAPIEDFDGNPRPSGGAVDVGAYEYQYALGVQERRPSSVIPTRAHLLQNFPNPFNPTTTIRFSLPGADHVTLQVSNLLGQEVAMLVSEVKNAGTHEVTFSAAGLPSGCYVCILTAGGWISVSKMAVVK